MKATKLIATLMLMLASVSEIGAQGIKVYLKDGTVKDFSYLELDSIIGYESNKAKVYYVDLGLSVKWATCNLGASSPEEYGNYYAWGEIKPRTGGSWNYTWSTSPYCQDALGDSWSKYNDTDGKTVLDPEDDAAIVALGSPWRLPTIDEIQELIDKCTWTWTTMSGKNGYEVVGPNGNSIFLPAAGYRYGTSLFDAGTDGFYWSSSLFASEPYAAYYLCFYSVNYEWDGYFRSHGQSVRPVRP